jgi:hypothetical protein
MNNEHRDYAKVIKVLKSCVDYEQLGVAETMYENYRNMYPESQNNPFDFNGILRSKIRQIRDTHDEQKD